MEGEPERSNIRAPRSARSLRARDLLRQHRASLAVADASLDLRGTKDSTTLDGFLPCLRSKGRCTPVHGLIPGDRYRVKASPCALSLDGRLATHSAVSPNAADGCIARMMRKPNGARLTSDAALLLL